MAKYEVSWTGSGLDALIEGVERFEKSLASKTDDLVLKLAEKGYEVAQMSFFTAQYDGTNDVSVEVEIIGNGEAAVVATGQAVLFIEFGTGVTYPDNHPEAAANGMIRGTYGWGQGSLPHWYYNGDPGTNGEVVATTTYGTRVKTSGNPASMSMYNAAKQLREDLPKIVKEVFG